MLWLVLGILLLLWTIRFGFEAGGLIVMALLIGLWIIFLVFLFLRRKSTSEPPVS